MLYSAICLNTIKYPFEMPTGLIASPNVILFVHS